MMHGSEWTLKYDEPEVEDVARGRIMIHGHVTLHHYNDTRSRDVH